MSRPEHRPDKSDVNQPYIKLQPSESTIVLAAAQIYGAYIQNGDVTEDNSSEFIRRAIKDAIRIVQITDAAIVADREMD